MHRMTDDPQGRPDDLRGIPGPHRYDGTVGTDADGTQYVVCRHRAGEDACTPCGAPGWEMTSPEDRRWSNAPAWSADATKRRRTAPSRKRQGGPPDATPSSGVTLMAIVDTPNGVDKDVMDIYGNPFSRHPGGSRRTPEPCALLARGRESAGAARACGPAHPPESRAAP